MTTVELLSPCRNAQRGCTPDADRPIDCEAWCCALWLASHGMVHSVACVTRQGRLPAVVEARDDA